MIDHKVNVEQILLGYYIKYNKLQELVTNELEGSQYGNSEIVDIYIDLYDMFIPLYTSNIYAENNFTIVSSVINLAAHMRSFFRTRYNVYSRIFLVYGDESNVNHRQFYISFGETKIKESLNYVKIHSIITSQLDMLKILCAYINDVYLIRRTSDFSMFTYDNIMQNQNIPSIILTKSKYAYQITAMCNNAFIFRPKKYNGEDISYSVNNRNVLFMLNKKINSKDTLDKLKIINPRLCSVLMCLTGLPSKKLLTLFNITTGVGRLNKVIIENKIINDYNSDIDYLYNQLQLFSKIDQVSFKCRFNAVDLVFQHRIYINSAESKDISWNINLEDKRSFHEINNKYFINNPLDVGGL